MNEEKVAETWLKIIKLLDKEAPEGFAITVHAGAESISYNYEKMLEILKEKLKNAKLKRCYVFLDGNDNLTVLVTGYPEISL